MNDKSRKINCAVALLALVASACARGDGDASARAPTWPHRVIAQHAHDATLFTQGVAWRCGALIESGGGYGASRIVVRDLASGAVTHERALPRAHFGEGATALRDEIFQLTWREGVVHVYDLALRPRRTLPLRGEGWGLTHDGTALWLSDGSDVLRRLDAATLAPLARVAVRDGSTPVRRLNELEYAGGLIFANVWHSDRVAAIDPADGQVRAWLDFADLEARLPPGTARGESVLNGIAYMPARGHFLVTGKRWPLIFEVAFDSPDAPAPAEDCRAAR